MSFSLPFRLPESISVILRDKRNIFNFIKILHFVQNDALFFRLPFYPFRLPETHSTYFNLPSRLNGGGNRDRTDDPLLAKQMLYQLSYTPNPLNGGSGRT